MRHFLFTVLCFTFFKGAAQSGNSNTAGSSGNGFKIGVRVSYVASGESFTFRLTPDATVTVTKSNTLVNFPGNYSTGQTFVISQISGPRSVFFTGNSNRVTIGNANAEALADAGQAPGNWPVRGEIIAPPNTLIGLQLNGTNNTTINTGEWGRFVFNFPDSVLEGNPFNVSIIAAPANVVFEKIVTGVTPGIISGNNYVKIKGDYKYDLMSRGNGDSVKTTFFESWDAGIDKALEDNGRYVVFTSGAKGLCGASGKYRQVYKRDRLTGETIMLSRAPNGEEGNGNSSAPVISVMHIYVAFESYATNLVANDNNGARDVFLWFKGNGGTVTRVSVSSNGTEANGESYEPSITGNAGYIAFTSSATNLAEENTEVAGANVYLHDKNNKTTILISKDPKTGKGVGGSRPSIDMNGYRMAFCSFANTLVPGDNNNLWDIFLWERNSSMQALPLKRITMAYDGSERNQGDESSSRVVAPTISGLGRYIAYATTATNVVLNDNNKMQDVFVYDIENNTTATVSVDNNGTEGNGNSPAGQGEKIALSINAEVVVFTSNASNFGTPAGNVVAYRLNEHKMVPVSFLTGAYVSAPEVSRTGKYVVFGSSQPLDKRFVSSGLFAAFMSPAY